MPLLLGGLDRRGEASPDAEAVRKPFVSAVTENLRSGEPMCPNGDAPAAPNSPLSVLLAKKAPNRDGDAVDGDPTFDPGGDPIAVNLDPLS